MMALQYLSYSLCLHFGFGNHGLLGEENQTQKSALELVGCLPFERFIPKPAVTTFIWESLGLFEDI